MIPNLSGVLLSCTQRSALRVDITMLKFSKREEKTRKLHCVATRLQNVPL